MRKLRKVQLASFGLTLALIGPPQAATAHPFDTDTTAKMPAKAKGLLYRELFTLSPAEKLKIGGDRVRLAQADAPKKPAAKKSSKSKATASKSTNPIRCLKK